MDVVEEERVWAHLYFLFWQKNTKKLEGAVECFGPTITYSDVVKGIMFHHFPLGPRPKSLRVQHSRFEERNELIAVANVRIHGEKVAEIPLIASRTCRLEGCSFLMSKQLRGCLIVFTYHIFL